MKKTLKVEGMMCGHCEARVKKALEALPEVDEAVVSHEAGTAIVTLNAEVADDVLKNAVLIPQKCVVLTQKGSLVMGVDKDNKVYAIPVTLSVAVGDRYLVDSGLKGGERIISEGLVKARPGTQVRVQEPAAEQQQAQAPSAQK